VSQQAHCNTGDTDGTGGAGGQARFRDPMAVVASGHLHAYIHIYANI